MGFTKHLGNTFMAAVAIVGIAIAGGIGVRPTTAQAQEVGPSTPIKHLVVIFQENVSFDHYFATYPRAANRPGEPFFEAQDGTPSVNNLLNAGLLVSNPNSALPFRLDGTQANTCDQNHDYQPEQEAANGGAMDKFVEFAGVGSTLASPCNDYGKGPSLVMGYFDGNTTTALWNYAQQFAMSDNFFNTTFGPSTPGALNLVSGQTPGAVQGNPTKPLGEDVVVNADGSLTVIGDPQPFFDDCSTRETVKITGPNVGDLLEAKGVTWGWFEGGFAPTTPATPTSPAVCGASHTGSNGLPKKDYIPHHEPFQYYESTANRHHLPPSSVATIGHPDQANHQYDLSDFWAAAEAGNLPAVSFLKAPGFQDGHAGYSDPLLEQQFLVNTLNRLQELPQWEHTAVIITYDDSDGSYDHVAPPIVNGSQTDEDAAICDTSAPSLGTSQGRCGYGPRLPMLVISPFAKANFVDHTRTDQSSILRFIEDNWGLGRISNDSFDQKAGSILNMFDFKNAQGLTLFLDPSTGQPLQNAP